MHYPMWAIRSGATIFPKTVHKRSKQAWKTPLYLPLPYKQCTLVLRCCFENCTQLNVKQKGFNRQLHSCHYIIPSSLFSLHKWPKGHLGWQDRQDRGLAWILQNRRWQRQQRRHTGNMAATMMVLPAKNLPWLKACPFYTPILPTCAE